MRERDRLSLPGTSNLNIQNGSHYTEYNVIVFFIHQMINVLISSQMCINELQMDHDHTYTKDHNRELRIVKKKFDLVTFPQDEENNDNVSGSSGTTSRVLQAELGQGEEEGEDITFPLSQDLAAEAEEEGFSFMPSRDLAAEGEEEGRTRDCEEVEAQDPGSERSCFVKPELTSD